LQDVSIRMFWVLEPIKIHRDVFCKTLGISSKYITIGIQLLLEIYHVFFCNFFFGIDSLSSIEINDLKLVQQLVLEQSLL
jgi:hypothetical protein